MNKKFIKATILGIASLISVTGCSFVHYETIEPSIVEPTEITKLKQEKINALNESYSSDMYYAVEMMTFEQLITEYINRINEATTEVEINTLYEEACGELNQVKTIEQYVVEEAEKLEEYRRASVNKILTYVNVEDYREAEQQIIDEKIVKYIELVNSAETYEKIDEYVRQYKTEIYELYTDQEYYNQELSSLKEELINDIYNLVNIYLYREAESEKIRSIIENTEAKINACTAKEDALEIYSEAESSILSLKTDEQLTILELEEFANEYVSLLKERLITSGLSNPYYEDASTLLIEAETVLLQQTSKDEVIDKYIFYLKKIFKDAVDSLEETGINGYKNACIEQIQLTINVDDYEYGNQEIVIEEIQKAVNALNTCSIVSDFEEVMNDMYAVINIIPKKSTISYVEQFRNDLHDLYGDNILKEPECGLEVANDMFELADIVDYYAFYQMSDDRFLCNTIVVDLNFEFPSNPLRFFNYYPYLFSNCVDYRFSLSKNQLVITLSAAPFADFNQCHKEKHLTPYVTYKDAHTNKRSADFEDFPYTHNENLVTGIWNDQQLYYALFKGYNVEVVEGSLAEEVLNLAKDILREHVNDEMSIEEKIFNIMSWFGASLYRGWKFYKTLPTNDIGRRAEACLRGYPGVCRAANKAYVILTRMEGIVSQMTCQNSGDHTDSLVVASDGKHYATSPYYCFGGFSTDQIAYSYDLIATNSQKFYKSTLAYKQDPIIPSEGLYVDLYDKLLYHDVNIFVRNVDELNTLIAEFNKHEGEICNVLIETSNTDLIEYFEGLTDITKKALKSIASNNSDLAEYYIK